jgi:hypothetical protein
MQVGLLPVFMPRSIEQTTAQMVTGTNIRLAEAHVLKWPGKTGQRAKMYPTLKTGCTNDEKMQFSDKFMATVALEALRGGKTVQEIAAKDKVHLLPTGVCTQTPGSNAGDDMETSGD